MKTVIKLHLILFPWTLWSCFCCCWGFFLPTGYCATWGNSNERLQGKTQLSEIRPLPLLTYVSLSFSPFHFCCHFKVIIGCKEASASGVEAKQLVCPQSSAAPRRGTKPSALDCRERNRPSTPGTPPAQCPLSQFSPASPRWQWSWNLLLGLSDQFSRESFLV